MGNIYYRRTMSAIGLGMLLFLLLFNVAGVLLSILSPVIYAVADVKTATVIYELTYGAIYLVSFMLPGLFIRKKLKKEPLGACPVRSSFKLSPYLPLIIFASVTLIFMSAYVNAFLVEIFNYGAYSEGVLWDDNVTENYQIVLQFITLCVVPGICEEFLFRGVILSHLRPFGEGKAVLISALLFALMHQNVGQFLYTFCAGVILGLVYEKTNNVWNGTIVHLINNFVSSTESIVMERLSSRLGELVGFLIEGGFFLLGGISLVILIGRFFTRPDLSDGFFGRELPPRDGYAVCRVTGGETVRGFFRPSVIAFTVISVAEMVFLIVEALLYVG